ncbi:MULTISPECIES: hypothetical protein [unclassified Thermosynechococcus]|uniref:hypothetical protein n=2 Tax=unclassified Thermosynechococcus TaxID=2622553 RepID=UPI00197ECEB4|nr:MULTISPECIES: hypothetical protein [unclassified Thermosynechococcus]QSF48953.1 hypothetical protein JW907_11585 [Thermosynechococcus sp. TA-1]WNC37294.1 hypothetical protein RHI11_11505 [Thermosynechococcus sp. WL11]WNC39816.1 hypothetical protein RHI18_11510 [Thermosynechococcus sp. WL17]WNC42336.1 hypothetical protein RHI14_11495 [Thermosynechococcus sp. WL15]WNC44861.1 hypothetical protein RHI63_11600 [Thermosynechococcus sp. GLH187]
MGDRELIDQFIKDLIQKNSRMLSNRHLRVETTFDEVQLISYKDGIVARVKTDAPTLAIEVRDASPYRPLIQEVMVDYEIFQVGVAQTPGCLRYEHRTVPEGYVIQYTEAGVLWKDRWARGKRRGALTGGNSLGMDAMILYRGTWYPIQSVNAANGFVAIRTLGGEATYSASDFLVWLKKEEKDTAESPSQISAYKRGERMGDIDSAPTQILEATEIMAAKASGTPSTPIASPAGEPEKEEDHAVILPSAPPVPAVAATVSTPSEPAQPVEATQDHPAANYEHAVGYSHPNYDYFQGYPAANYEHSVGYPHPNYDYSQGYPAANYEHSVGYPHPNYDYSQGYPAANYEHSVGYAHPSYGQPYPPQTYQHIDPNIQMALTYLQSSLAYLLQVEPKNANIHAAIRATSMAIQNLLTLLNG